MKAHGSLLGLEWVLALIYGTPMGRRWAFDGFLAFPWVPGAAFRGWQRWLVGLPLGSYRFVVLPWPPMGFLWGGRAPMGLPWVFHGTPYTGP